MVFAFGVHTIGIDVCSYPNWDSNQHQDQPRETTRSITFSQHWQSFTRTHASIMANRAVVKCAYARLQKNALRACEKRKYILLAHDEEEVKKHHNNDTAKRSKNKTFIKTLLHTRNGVSISSGRCHRPKAQVQLARGVQRRFVFACARCLPSTESEHTSQNKKRERDSKRETEKRHVVVQMPFPNRNKKKKLTSPFFAVKSMTPSFTIYLSVQLIPPSNPLSQRAPLLLDLLDRRRRPPDLPMRAPSPIITNITGAVIGADLAAEVL
jgi:hypothetical protein